MHAFEIDEVAAARLSSGKLYHEFLRVPAMSAGLYCLPAGGVDPQRPHTEDEIYYIISGAAVLRVAGEERNIGPGAIIYVPAGVEHRFHTMTEELQVLVFFAPAKKDV
jgi:mannose-6-phosphate isomerase-like protein (cupin superfamily)